MKGKKKKFLNDKGVTGIDVTISIIVLTIFAGLIINLMSSIYKNSIEIQKGANAMAYATIVLEKVDEKAFDEIDDNFVNTLTKEENPEIAIDPNYAISFSTENLEENLLKKVRVEVSYEISGEAKSLIIYKLKIKEIYKEWRINI